MKPKYLVRTSTVSLILALPAGADVIYSNLKDIAIPTTFAGVYLDVDTGNWNTNINAPQSGWDINPFFGGSALWNSPGFQPVRSGTGAMDAVLNLAEGTTVGGGSVFSTFVQGPGGQNPGGAAYGASETHMGNGAGQFVEGSEGYIGFRMTGGNYGWMRVVLTNNTGGALIKEWAYENNGTSIGVANVKHSGSTVTLDSVTGSFTISSAIIDSGGATNLAKTASGTTTLTGTNTYTGTTTVSAGTLEITNNSGLGTTAAGTTVDSGAALQLSNNVSIGAETLGLSGSGVSNTGALRSVSGSNSFAGAITLGSASRINSDSGSLTLSGNIDGAAQNLTIGGAGNTTISGAIATTTGTLTKDGAGTLTLSGTSTYTGATTVSAGSMLVNGVLSGTSGTTVSSGALLGGTGSITNGVSVLAGGTLSPGASIESLGLGSLDLDGSLLIEWDTTASPNIDFLNIAGTLNLGSNSSVTFTNLGAGSLDLNTPYIFASYGAGGLTGTFNSVNLLPSGFTLDYNYGGLNQIAIVPEPSSLLISILLSIPMVLRRKRGER